MIFTRLLPTLLLGLHRLVFMPLGFIFALSLGQLLSPKIRLGLKLRMNSKKENKPALKNPIWIHVSSGEFEYAKPLLPKLKKAFPDSQILVTYYSPSYRGPVEAHPLVDLALPLPLDFAGACTSFLNKHQPKMLLIARTDLWPEMLYQCRIRKIPSYIFSARCGTHKSPLKAYFSYWIYQFLDHIFCVNSEHKVNFEQVKIPSNKITACGDTRFDQVFERLQAPHNIKTELFNSNVQTLVAGSTWPADESIIIPQMAELLRNSKLRLIIAPHEPNSKNINQLKAQLDNYKLHYSTYSDCSSWDTPVLIIDQVGLLAHLYPYGDFAFIGNSFEGQVHSVMEPLAAGCLCFVGPKHLKSPEAVDFKNHTLNNEFNMVNVVSDRGFDQQLEAAVKLDTDFKDKIVEVVRRNTGASERLIGEIKGKLKG